MRILTSCHRLLLLLTLLSSFATYIDCFSAMMPSSSVVSTSDVNQKLSEMGIEIKQPPTPRGNYVSVVRSQNMLYVCGHIPQRQSDGSLICGTLGKDMDVKEGYESAKACAINILNTLHAELDGDWSKIVRIVKVVGFVNSANDFYEQPAVINGASDLFGQVFGPAGVHARSAVGSNVLPLNIATEVECVVEVTD